MIKKLSNVLTFLKEVECQSRKGRADYVKVKGNAQPGHQDRRATPSKNLFPHNNINASHEKDNPVRVLPSLRPSTTNDLRIPETPHNGSQWVQLGGEGGGYMLLL